MSIILFTNMEEKFDLSKIFDISILNLNIYTNYIYVLELVEKRYYIGRTGNIFRRLEEHFSGYGSIYTKKYKPIKVIEITEEITNDDEKNKTIEFMNVYGWENVRGSCWCSLEIKKPNMNKKFNKNKITKNEDKLTYIDDKEIIDMYLIKNYDINEIGNRLNRTPGSVANRLEKLSIIEKKQLAIGYEEYINSKQYNELCKNKIERKKNVYVTNINMTKLKENINLSIKNFDKINTLEIKNKIIDKFLHDN